mgnify:CR=1 FL=1
MPNYYAFGRIFWLATDYFIDIGPIVHKGESKMKISKQRLKQILKEELEMAHMALPNGEVDQEGRMAKRQLSDIAEYAAELSQMLSDETQLEAWVQSKLTKAADYIKTVKHYVEYGMEEGAYDQVVGHSAPEMPEMAEMGDSMVAVGEFPLETSNVEEESEENYEY